MKFEELEVGQNLRVRTTLEPATVVAVEEYGFRVSFPIGEREDGTVDYDAIDMVPADAEMYEPVAQEIPICGCTNTQLERSETCGLDMCPNQILANGKLGIPRKG